MSATTKTWIDNQPPSFKAEDLNGLKNENNNAIEGSNQVLDTADNQQTHKTFSTYSSVGQFFTGAGIADAYTLTVPSPRIAPHELQDGMVFRATMPFDNTGASTINPFTLDVSNIKLQDGTTDPLAGDILSTVESTFIYRTSYVELVNPQSQNFVSAKSGRKNLLHGNFVINQRVVSGTVILSAGEYGHDGFRGGSAGCTYTFATSLNITTATISAGTLEKEVEGINVQSGEYVLSWSGTAQGRIDGASYGDSGDVTDTLVGGTNTIIEFDTGTLALTQLEKGSVATEFEDRTEGEELALCRSFFRKNYNLDVAPGTATSSGAIRYVASGANNEQISVPFDSLMRATPTMTIYSTSGSEGDIRDPNGSADRAATLVDIGHGGFTVNKTTAHSDQTAYQFFYTASAEI